MISTTPAVDLLTEYLRAFELGDIAAVIATFDENIVMKVPCMPEPTPKVIVGRATIESILKWTFSNVFKKLTWTELEVHASDDPSLAFAIAKSSAELWNGKSYDNEYVIYVRVREGKIVEDTEFFDMVRAAKAFSVAVSVH